jgi:hypothetical protein
MQEAQYNRSVYMKNIHITEDIPATHNKQAGTDTEQQVFAEKRKTNTWKHYLGEWLIIHDNFNE